MSQKVVDGSSWNFVQFPSVTRSNWLDFGEDPDRAPWIFFSDSSPLRDVAKNDYTAWYFKNVLGPICFLDQALHGRGMRSTECPSNIIDVIIMIFGWSTQWYLGKTLKFAQNALSHLWKPHVARVVHAEGWLHEAIMLQGNLQQVFCTSLVPKRPLEWTLEQSNNDKINSTCSVSYDRVYNMREKLNLEYYLQQCVPFEN